MSALAAAVVLSRAAMARAESARAAWAARRSESARTAASESAAAAESDRSAAGRPPSGSQTGAFRPNNQLRPSWRPQLVLWSGPVAGEGM